LQVYGYSREEFTGLNIKDLRAPETLADFEKQLEVLKNSSESLYETIHKRKDGSTFPVEASIRHVEIDGEKFLQGIIRDISERKQAEEVLYQEKIFTDKLLNAPRDTVFLFDPITGKPIRWNEQFVEVSGYSSDEIKNMKAPDDFYSEDDLEKAKETIEKIFAGGQGTVELSLITKQGKQIQFEYTVTIVETTNHHKLFLSIGRDITERKKAEVKLKELSSRNEAILSSVPDIIMEVDNNKVYTWANKTGLEFFGEDVIGKEASYYFVGEQKTYEYVHPLFKGDENIFYVESWQRRKNGEKRLLGWWCKVLKDTKGNVTGALSSAQDITERKQAEEK